MTLARRFAREIRRQIDPVLGQQFTGSYIKTVTIVDAATSAPAVKTDHEIIDHFKLHIPYAGYVLVWEVRFDLNCLDFAPDFVFDDEAFLAYLDIDTLWEKVPSLSSWNVENPNHLSQVIQEILNLYTTYQLQRLERDGSSVSDECAKLMQEFELDPCQLQVLPGDSVVASHCIGSSTRPPHDTVSVMVLDVQKQLSISPVPEQYSQMALQFQLKEFSTTRVMFHISPVLQHVLGEHGGELEFPGYLKNDGPSTYFRHFLEVTKAGFSEVRNSYNRRQEFHLELIRELSSIEFLKLIPAENDMPQFTSSSYLLQMGDFIVTAIVKTPSHSLADSMIKLISPAGDESKISIDWTLDIKNIRDRIIDEINAFTEVNGAISE